MAKKPESYIMSEIALIILAVAAVLTALYMISRIGTRSSITILAIIVLSAIAALWYNYMAGRSAAGI